MKPRLTILEKKSISDIVSHAKELLESVGIEIEEKTVVERLADNGARYETASNRVFIPANLVDKCLEATPDTIRLYDRDCREVAVLGQGDCHFVPGSSALDILDANATQPRKARRDDLDRIARLTEQIPQYPIQSTALVPSDVPAEISDRIRLLHALRECTKPVVTGTFHQDGFASMLRMLEAVRGGSEALRSHPMAVFDCCPSPPLKWPRLTAQAIVDCAENGVPAEIVPVPLSGATGPVTLDAALVQIVAENLSGIAISQCFCLGAPVIFGGCPMSFDMRHGTTPAGAPETILLNAAVAQIAAYLGLPSHGYLALSDARVLDAQAGAETAMGALAASLGGTSIASGAGMLRFIGCQSMEKLLFDAQICQFAGRFSRGVTSHDNSEISALFLEAIDARGFLGLQHTRKYHREELTIPSQIIDRQASTEIPDALLQRCRKEVEKIVTSPSPKPLTEDVLRELQGIEEAELRRYL